MSIVINFIEIEEELNPFDAKFTENITKYSSLNDIIQLNNYDDIKYISCCNLDINALPTLPKNLISLYCANNSLKHKIFILL